MKALTPFPPGVGYVVRVNQSATAKYPGPSFVSPVYELCLARKQEIFDFGQIFQRWLSISIISCFFSLLQCCWCPDSFQPWVSWSSYFHMLLELFWNKKGDWISVRGCAWGEVFLVFLSGDQSESRWPSRIVYWDWQAHIQPPNFTPCLETTKTGGWLGGHEMLKMIMMF